MQNDLNEWTDELLQQRIAELQNELARLRASQIAADKPGMLGDESFEKIFDFPALAVMRADVNGRILDANDTFINLLGYTREELQEGKVRWDEITAPEYAQLDREKIKDIERSGCVYPYEKVMIHKDGTRIPISMAARKLDTLGEDCFCSIIDLREQKETEAAITKSEADFRLLADSIPQVVFSMGTDGRVNYFNDRYWQMTGLDPKTCSNDIWLSTLHPDDVPRALRNWKLARATNRPLEMELRRKNKEGYGWILTRALPQFNESGEVIQWLGTSTDIDAQKQSVADLEASEERFRTMADAIPQIVWTAQTDGRIDFFNHRFFEYSGLTVEQSLNDGWQLLIHPDDLESYLSRWQRARQTGEGYELQFGLKRAVGLQQSKKGAYRKHLAKVVPWKSPNGTILKWFATWTEIEFEDKQIGNR